MFLATPAATLVRTIGVVVAIEAVAATTAVVAQLTVIAFPTTPIDRAWVPLAGTALVIVMLLAPAFSATLV